MSKHTPGPWVVCSTISSLGVSTNGARTAMIANGSDWSDADAANARLIAAAPDLLAALKDIKREADAQAREVNWHEIVSEFCARAIEKAEGR